MPAVITHIVLFESKPHTSAGPVETLRQALADLVGVIPGLTSFAWGTNVSPEGKGQGFDLGFVMEFDRPASRDAYLPHPAHVAVGPLVRAVADDVLVYDLEK
jgi:Stress responsive A/B Barrel Domain